MNQQKRSASALIRWRNTVGDVVNSRDRRALLEAINVDPNLPVSEDELDEIRRDLRRERAAWWEAWPFIMTIAIGALLFCLVAWLSLPWLLQSMLIAIIFVPCMAFGIHATLKGPAGRRWRIHLRRRGYAICIECGYDTRGSTSAKCPECGTTLEPRANGEQAER